MGCKNASFTARFYLYNVFLDEIQKVVTIQNPYIEGVEDKIGFVDVLLGLMKRENIDIYATVSNSKMLSSDILTEFRGRGDEIRVNPLSYAEFYNSYTGEKQNVRFRGILTVLQMRS